MFNCSHLWFSFKPKSFNDFKVAYNNVFRGFFHVPRHVDGTTVSVSDAQLLYMCIPSPIDVTSRVGKGLYARVLNSRNTLINSIKDTDMFAHSELSRKWRDE